MGIFNSNANAFSTAPFVPPLDDYNLKIIRLTLSEWDYDGKTNLKLTIGQRIESDNPETNAKPLNRELNFAVIDKETREVIEWTRDWPKVAEVLHAAFGFENNSAEADAAFSARFTAEDFDISLGTSDSPELKLTGNGWDQLVDCSYRSTVKTGTAKNGRTPIYFNSVRPVNSEG